MNVRLKLSVMFIINITGNNKGKGNNNNTLHVYSALFVARYNVKLILTYYDKIYFLNHFTDTLICRPPLDKIYQGPPYFLGPGEPGTSSSQR